MRSVVAGTAQVLVPLGVPRTPLLPHNSSSSHVHLCTSRRQLVAAAREGGGDWYSSNSSSGGSGSGGSGGQDSSSTKKTRSRHYYDSTPKYKSKRSSTDPDAALTDAVADALSASFGNISSGSSSSSRGRGSSSRGGRGRSRGVSTADGYVDDLEDEEEDEVQGQGWWEVPREQRWGSSAAAAADSDDFDLEPWQEQQLLLAAASSKKKMQVQSVAANVGLDRSEVLAWVAAFRAKPKSEQAKLLAPLQDKIQRMKAQQQAQVDAAVAAEAARRDRAFPRQQQQQEQQQDGDSFYQQPQHQQQQQQQQVRPAQQQQGLPFSGKNPDTGFVPFTERRGSSKSKRLSGEVLRTLEGVYARSPWPNKEVVAGLLDLHRLPRDTVLDWFTARREMDGLPDNPRAAKQLAATAKRVLDAPQPLLPADMLPQQRQPKQPPAAAAAAATGTEAQPSGSTQQQQQQQQQQQRVQSLTAREMAALRSALPSPRKQKGEKLKQELGVKAGPDGNKQVEIAGVTFIAKDGRAGWRNAWRKRRSEAGVPAQQLDFNLWLLRQEQQQQQQQEQ